MIKKLLSVFNKGEKKQDLTVCEHFWGAPFQYDMVSGQDLETMKKSTARACMICGIWREFTAESED